MRSGAIAFGRGPAFTRGLFRLERSGVLSKRDRHMQQGFSFVEVLIVIVVFGIVVGIVSMVVANMVNDPKVKPSSVEQAKACQVDQRVYAVAVQAFKLKNDGQAPKSAADIVPLVKQ